MTVIQGLKLSLAEWDQQRGLVSGKLTQQYSTVPDLYCWAEEDFPGTARIKTDQQKEEEDRPAGSEQYYRCPMYASAEKLKLIATIPLRTTESLQNFQLLGVTLSLC